MIDDVHISSNKHRTEKKRSCNPWRKKQKKSRKKNSWKAAGRIRNKLSTWTGRRGSWGLVFAYLSSCWAGVCVCECVLLCYSVCDIHLKIPLDATPITTRRCSRCEANLISGSVKHTNCSWQQGERGERSVGCIATVLRIQLIKSWRALIAHSQRTRSALEKVLEQLRGIVILKMSFALPLRLHLPHLPRPVAIYNITFLTHHLCHAPPLLRPCQSERNQRSRPSERPQLLCNSVIKLMLCI